MGDVKSLQRIVIDEEDKRYFAIENSTDASEIAEFIDIGLPLERQINYNIDGLKLLLTKEKYYNALCNLLESNTSKFSIGKDVFNFKDSKGNSVTWNIGGIKTAVNKNTFVLMLEDLYKAGKLANVKQIKDKIEHFKNIIDMQKLVIASPKYEILVNNQKRSISTAEIVNFIKLNAKNTDFNKIEKQFGVQKNEFVYMVNQFIKQNKIVSNYFLNAQNIQFLQDLKNDKYADTYSFNRLTETDDPNTIAINLNPKMLEYVYKNLPKDYTQIEKAVFFYIKLVRKLNYDIEFYAELQRGEVANRHKDIKQIESIDPDDNKSVVCYEINQILAELLRQNGIDYKMHYMSGKYGQGHANLTFKANDYVVFADGIEAFINNDFIKSKVDEELVGLKCKNTNEESVSSFKKIVDKVYKDVQELEPSPFVDESFEKSKEILSTFANDLQEVSIKEKIEIFKKITLESKLPAMEKIGYYTRIYNKFFAKSKKSHMTIVSYKKDDAKFKTLTLILTYNEKLRYIDIDSDKYFIMDDNSWKEISIEELQRMFDSGKLGYISPEKVPGIKERHGKVENNVR